MSAGKGKRRRSKLRLLDRIGLLVTKSEYVDGLWIGANHDNPDLVLGRLRAALSLLKTYDPLRYTRLRHDLERICAAPITYPIACYVSRLRACEINPRYVLAEATTNELIASTIVHEATHARLMSRGIGYAEDIRARVEAVCIRRQLAFSRKLSSGQQACEHAKRQLLHCDSSTFMSASLSKLADDQGVIELRALGVPEALIKAVFLARRTRWRLVGLSRTLKSHLHAGLRRSA